MPAALDVDREQVRMLAVSVGVREAARQLGLDENTVKQWSARYGWMKDIPRSKPLPPTMIQPVTIVTTPANAQVNVLRQKLLRTRENHVDLALSLSEELKQKPASKHATEEGVSILLQAGKHAALTGGWSADTRPDSPGKAFGARQMGLEIDAEADVIVGDVTECEDVSQT